jgi:tetratricopeptide (TPR) repeat protein
MKILNARIAGLLAACFVGLAMLAQPGRLLAQAVASIHGHVQNAAGQTVGEGEVRLTTDKNPNAPGAKFEFTFQVDKSGNYQGTDIKPGTYIVLFFDQGHSVDFFVGQSFAAGENKTVDFDMTRPEFLKTMSPADRDALEEFKKKNAEVTAANAKIENLNGLLKTARDDTKAGNFDGAVKAMTDATAAKPDEPILWDTLGDAQLGLANAAAKTAHDNKTTDLSLGDKFQAAITSYQKALSLNATSAKPSPDLVAAANNQMAQALGKIGKAADASAAYDAAAKADPPKAAMYYFNEAATAFNANDMDGAAAAADKAIAADPTKVDAYYIKGQALIPKATLDPATNKIVAPPDCIAAYNKYLELAPDGSHAQEIKDILAGIGAAVPDKYKAPPAKKK